MPEKEEQPKKRPIGLKARAAAAKNSKKSKDQVDTQQTIEQEDPNTTTIALKYKEGEKVDEIDEVEGIYENAIEAISTDPEQATALLRGTIHECDYLLRSKHNNNSVDSLSPKFYYVYGMALFTLGELAEPEDAKEYFETSHSRLEQALEVFVESESSNDLKQKIYAGLAKSTLSQARFISESDIDDTTLAGFATKATDYFDKSIECLSDKNSKAFADECLAAADLVFSFAETFVDIASLQTSINWGIEKLKGINNDEVKLQVFYSLAKGYWVAASHYLDQQDEETGEIPERDTVSQLLNQAEQQLVNIQNEKPTDPEILSEVLVLLGEIQINKGNIQEEEENQEKEYDQAVKTLTEAKKVFPTDQEFPEHLQAFIDDSN